MNFFEHQDRARRNTAYLVGLFGVAIATMILALYLTILLIQFESTEHLDTLWQPQLLVLLSLGVGGMIGFGSVRKTLALRGGGSVIALNLGGRLVVPETHDAQERRLLNVVEEMAIAAGISVPQVYLLDQEPGINAFAAGYSPNEAVIGVTQGCLDLLNRDELQGVIGHEFSHILNGDMRLNLKLIGVLHGILMIHLIGRAILRHGSRSSRRRKDKEGGGLFAFALAMLVIGGIGWVCGRLIKSAVSRQREFLADASAVQFTRNADGIGNALRKIASHADHSQVHAPSAEEASHLFFGDIASPHSLWQSFSSAFATHPPLSERIRRITGSPLELSSSPLNPAATTAVTPAPEGMLGFQTATIPPVGVMPSLADAAIATTPAKVITQIGTVAPAHLKYAQALIAALPTLIRDQLPHPNGALAIAYALFLDRDEAMRSHQLTLLKSTAPPAVMALLTELQPVVATLPLRTQLPLLELCVPSLRTLTPEAAVTFFKAVQSLVRADKRLSLTEYSLQIVLQHRLRPHFNPNKTPDKPYTHPADLWTESLQVLSALARVGHTTPEATEQAFRTGVYQLPGVNHQPLPPAVLPCGLYEVGKSLNKLALATPKLKQRVVDACAHTVLVDNQVTDAEAQLLRAIIIALDCPVPPFLHAGEAALGKGA
jgi:Zn-dependent protease with chaperone function